VKTDSLSVGKKK